MKRIIFFVVLAILISSCQPSALAISTAIAQTQAALPTPTFTDTPVPANTPTQSPTETMMPSQTTRPTDLSADAYAKTGEAQETATYAELISSLDELRQKFLATIVEAFNGTKSVKSVNLVQFSKGDLEIEIILIWASRETLMSAHFDMVKQLSVMFAKFPEETNARMAEGDTIFRIVMITYSEDLDYKYRSTTTYPTILKLAKSQISYDDWVKEASAGFVN